MWCPDDRQICLGAHSLQGHQCYYSLGNQSTSKSEAIRESENNLTPQHEDLWMRLQNYLLQLFPILIGISLGKVAIPFLCFNKGFCSFSWLEKKMGNFEIIKSPTQFSFTLLIYSFAPWGSCKAMHLRKNTRKRNSFFFLIFLFVCNNRVPIRAFHHNSKCAS